MANSFEEIMSKKTDAELIQIVTGPVSDYQAAALEAATNEFQKRNLSDKAIEKSTEEIEMTQTEVPINKFIKGELNTLIIYVVVLASINILLGMLDIKEGGATHLSGRSATSSEIRQATITTMIFGIPMIGFLIGFIVSLLPYKGRSYWKKYLRASLLSILSIYILLFLLKVIILIKKSDKIFLNEKPLPNKSAEVFMGKENSYYRLSFIASKP